jgi:hypothetical protein
MNLNITKERILEAAAKCSTAKQTLKVLFPEAFELPEITVVKPGDVFKHPEGNCNTFLVVNTRYSTQWHPCQNLQLLGIGCKVNSSEFFENHSTHTQEEVITYLKQRGMVYSHNIQDVIHKLYDADYVKKM